MPLCLKLSSINNVNEYFLASFDVSNLFTNVPLYETIEIILAKLFTNNSTFMSFSRNMGQIFT